MKFEINYKKKWQKNTEMWNINNKILNKLWITEEIKEKVPKSIGYSKGSSKRNVYRHKNLPQDRRKISNKQSKLTSNRARKRKTNKTQS